MKTIAIQDILFSLLRRTLGRRTISSSPFISGDTFRKLCDIDLTNSDFTILKKIDPSSKTNVFMPIGRAVELSLWLNANTLQKSNWQLVLHNGDHCLEDRELQTFVKIFSRVSSVNWLGNHKIATPLPIGLENFKYFRNGIPFFYTNRNKNVFSGWEFRTFEVFLSIKKGNNPKYRTGLETSLSFSEDNFIAQSFMSPTAHRAMLRNSRFVISPPGNGPDCHRTWEAIYLGAVPIVLRKFWNFKEMLPVLVVDNYENLEQDILKFKESFQFSEFDPVKILSDRYIYEMLGAHEIL
jgi:hypothetical protein